MQKILLKYLFFLLIAGIFGSGCQYNKSPIYLNSQMNHQVNLSAERTPGPKTILIHGTLLPGTVTLTRMFDFPTGFMPASEQPDRFIHSRIPRILNKVDPQQFPIETFYLYGWSGKLDFAQRKQAALNLYQNISHFKEPITIIAHSHGCNVALNLAEIAKEFGDTSLKIDRLILLAGPVQEATADKIKSSIFNKIYSFYSSADLMQVIDPQKLYKATPKDRKVSFFSKRTFEDLPNLIQTKVLIYNQPASHLDFILEKFIKWLPFIINLVDKEKEEAHAASEQNEKQHFTINIPKYGKEPYLIEQVDKYIPRSK